MKKQIKEIPSILFLMISFGIAIRVMTRRKGRSPSALECPGRDRFVGRHVDDRSSSCHRFGVVWITHPFATLASMV